MSMLQKFGRGQSSVAMVVAVVLSGLSGSYLISHSSAATAVSANPAGGIDYCTLSGTTTTFYGWGYDPNEPNVGSSQPFVNVQIGSTPHNSLPSAIAGYRDAAVNSYINSHYSSTSVKPGRYGWSTSYTGLQKGNSYSVTGTVLNYGAGANVKIGVATSDFLGPGMHGFPGYVVPDACLAAKPTPPSNPAPNPSPAPPPSGGTGGGTGTTTRRTTTTTPATPAAASISSDANATAAAGTTNASVKIPAGGATSVHVIYGTDAAILTSSTEDLNSTAGDVTVSIDSLNALTTYQFAIVRTASDGTMTTSPAASFKTKGYTLSIHFTDGNKKGVAGIQGTLDTKQKTKATSDKGGTMSFTDLPGGVYTVNYSYKGKTHSDEFDTDNAQVDTSSDSNATDTTPAIAVLTHSIDLSKLGSKLGVGASQAPSSSKTGAALAIVLPLLLIGLIIFVLRRRRRSQAASSGILPAPYNPATTALGTPDIIDQQMIQHSNAHKPDPGVAPAHMGESLREMVVKSMHEEAQKKRQQRPPQDKNE